MSEKEQDSAVAVEAPEKPAPAKAKPQPSTRPKPQRPYAVVVLNDDQHTFEYVIEVLQKTFGYDLPKALKLTLQVHEEGRSIVWTGPLETAEFKRDRIRGYGPDIYARVPVTFPLGCIIEPLAQ